MHSGCRLLAMNYLDLKETEPLVIAASNTARCWRQRSD
jgi:hypothetical protein